MTRPTTPEDLLALVNDEIELRRTLAELMSASEHPVLAEMGRAITDGETDWRGLDATSAYRDVLRTGLDVIGRLDLDEVAAGLDSAGVPPAPRGM